MEQYELNKLPVFTFSRWYPPFNIESSHRGQLTYYTILSLTVKLLIHFYLLIDNQHCSNRFYLFVTSKKIINLSLLNSTFIGK